MNTVVPLRHSSTVLWFGVRELIILPTLPTGSRRKGGSTRQFGQHSMTRKGEHFNAKGERFLIVKVADHKTSMTYGEAKLVLNEEVATWLDAFPDIVRPHRGTLEPTKPLSITTSGEKVTNLSNISILATEVNKTRVLKPTAA